MRLASTSFKRARASDFFRPRSLILIRKAAACFLAMASLVLFKSSRSVVTNLPLVRSVVMRCFSSRSPRDFWIVLGFTLTVRASSRTEGSLSPGL